MRVARSTIQVFAICTALGALAACSDQTPMAPRAPMASRAGPQPLRHMIVLKDGATAQQVADQVSALGGAVERRHDAINVLTAHGLSAAAVAALTARSDVEGIRADVKVQMIPPRERMLGKRVKLASDQSGAFFFDAFQWDMRQIKADKAWLVSKQGKKTLVCVLDSGIDPDHIDLQGKVDLNISKSFVATEPDIIDHLFHGTFVSALISTNGLGMASVAPDTRLCMIKVIDATGQGSFDDLISGILYAADQHADVINMSLGAYFQITSKDDIQLIIAVQRAINYALKKKVLPVAAAGNEGINLATDPPDFIELPAQAFGVISVGATGPQNQQNFDHIPSYSNVGFPGVEVFAPGGGDYDPEINNFTDLVFSACASAVPGCEDEESYIFANGTSFGPPHVVGEAAVIASDLPGNDKPLTLNTCVALTSDHPTGRFIDPIYGFGRIDVLRATKCRK